MFYALYCPQGINAVDPYGDMPIGFDTEKERDAFVDADPGDGVDIPFTREKTDFHYIMNRWGTAGAIVGYEDARRLLWL